MEPAVKIGTLIVGGLVVAGTSFFYYINQQK